MALSKHIDADELLEMCKDHPHYGLLEGIDPTIHKPVYGHHDIPKYTLPPKGISKSAAYQLIHDEMELDGTPILNLASFVNTGMDEHADKLMAENINKNFVDFDEYPATQAVHARCISILADLWKVPKGCKAIGTATTGSSEAIHLAGLAMKKRWQQNMKTKGKNIHVPGPNIVFGANAQVALEKFARYFDVEARLVPVTEQTNFVMDPKDAIKFVDENTIGIIVIFGSTYTGEFEDVRGMNDLLDKYQAETGIDIPIHVDGASGAFTAPFAYPDFEWGFSIPRVNSINASGHKYGMVYPGLGWLVIKDESLLPKDLIFELHYLGTAQSSYTLNFSRSAAPVLGQMYRFLTLGREGYTDVVRADLVNARLFSRALERTYFTILSNIHRPIQSTAATVSNKLNPNIDQEDPRNYHRGLPVIAFRLSDKFKAEHPHVKQSWIQQLLRARGWIVPNYNAPKNVEHIEMLRVVIRSTMSKDLVARLVVDLLRIVEGLAEKDSDSVRMMGGVTPSTSSAPTPPSHVDSGTQTPSQGTDKPSRHHATHGKHNKHGKSHHESHRMEHSLSTLIKDEKMEHLDQDHGEQVGFGRPC